MVDRFYDAYSKELNEEKIGRFGKWQLFWGRVLLVAIIASFAGVVFHKVKGQDCIAFKCVFLYVILAVSTCILIARFEKSVRDKLYTSNQSDRIDCMKKTIKAFLCEGSYQEKIDFITNLYERALAKKIEKQKLCRRMAWCFFTIVGVLITNIVNSPDSSMIQTILLAIVVILITLALGVTPFLLSIPFDAKKKTYEYMIVELQSIKVMISGQEEVEKRKNQQKLIELMNRVKNCLHEGKIEKIRVTIENKEE